MKTAELCVHFCAIARLRKSILTTHIMALLMFAMVIAIARTPIRKE